MRSADLTIGLPERMQLPLPEAIDGTAVRREEVLSWQVYPEDDVVGFLSLVTGDVGAVRRAVRELDLVRRVDITEIDDDSCYVYAEMDRRSADAALLDAVDERGLVVVPPVTYTDPETVHVTVLGDESALSGLVDRLPAEVSVDVRRVGEHRRRAGTLAGRLTERQFEALTAANAVGYYEVPREGSLERVADRLDCSEGTASTLLREAESRLVAAALGR